MDQEQPANELPAGVPSNRRSGEERRKVVNGPSDYDGPDRRASGDSGLERRRGPGLRRDDDRRSAEEGEMTAEQFEFIKAVETYKKVNKKMYPTWTEILEIFGQLGYRKVLAREVTLTNVPEPELYALPSSGGPAKKAA